MSIVLKPTVKQTATVIFLHGLGDTGHGWSTAFSGIKLPHVKYIFPTAPIRPITLNGGYEMTGWFDILGLKPNAPEDAEGINMSSEILIKLVEGEEKNGIPSERVIIGGFSQGGAVALYSAMSSTKRFGGVVALSTWLPMRSKVHDYLKMSESKTATPIFIGHGDVDDVVQLEWAKLSHKALQTIGFSNLTFKTYKGMAHSSSEEEMDDVDRYIENIFPK